MLKALTIGDTFEYVSDQDPCKKKAQVDVVPGDPSKGTVESVTIEDGATIFQLRPLDVFLMGYIFDNATVVTRRDNSDEAGISTRINKTNIDAVRFGLVGIKNGPDGFTLARHKDTINGREYIVCTDEAIEGFGLRLINELAGQIRDASEVKAGDVKTPSQHRGHPANAGAPVLRMHLTVGMGL